MRIDPRSVIGHPFRANNIKIPMADRCPLLGTNTRVPDGAARWGPRARVELRGPGGVGRTETLLARWAATTAIDDADSNQTARRCARAGKNPEDLSLPRDSTCRAATGDSFSCSREDLSQESR
jgi:hypothetical protein